MLKRNESVHCARERVSCLHTKIIAFLIKITERLIVCRRIGLRMCIVRHALAVHQSAYSYRTAKVHIF